MEEIQGRNTMSNHDESLGPEGYQVESVEKWISENVDNLSPPFKWTRLEGGHSNLCLLYTSDAADE